MPDRPADDLRADLTALIEPLARAARLALLLDERQPDALRADALGMRAERLFWTLTQLDAGLPLAVCQALVRAARLGRGGRTVTDAAEATSAELASTAAAAWLRDRLAGIVATTPLGWLGAVGPGRPLPAAPPAPAATWLDAPPIVGPPPGAAAAAGPVARLVAWLAGVRP